MGGKLQADSDKIDIFRYGLEIILGGMIKLIFISIVSYIFGVFQTTMVFIISYIPLRHFGGGVHLSTYCRCLTVGSIIFIFLGGIATRQINIVFLYIMTCIIFLIGIYIIVKWVPAGADKGTIISENAVTERKKRSLIALVLLCLGNIMFIRFNLNNHAFSSVLGLMVSLFFITPWGYGVIIMLDNVLNKIQGGITND